MEVVVFEGGEGGMVKCVGFFVLRAGLRVAVVCCSCLSGTSVVRFSVIKVSFVAATVPGDKLELVGEGGRMAAGTEIIVSGTNVGPELPAVAAGVAAGVDESGAPDAAGVASAVEVVAEMLADLRERFFAGFAPEAFGFGGAF